MKIKIEKKREWTIISIAGRLDASTSDILENQLNKIAEKKIDQILITFNELLYISSAGLRVLLSFAKQLHADNGQLCFAELGKSVKGVFEISGFYSLFTIYKNIEEALASA